MSSEEHEIETRNTYCLFCRASSKTLTPGALDFCKGAVSGTENIEDTIPDGTRPILLGLGVSSMSESKTIVSEVGTLKIGSPSVRSEASV